MVSTLRCSQCGRSAPADPEELSRWKHGDLVLAGLLDEAAAKMLLCSACVAEDDAREYDEGAGD